MRFGQAFHRHIVPEWHRYYLDYNSLKCLVKSDVSTASVLQHLEEGTTVVASLQNDRLSHITKREEALWSLFALAPPIASVAALDELDEAELTFLRVGLESLQQSLSKLLWFERVNCDAVEKIFAKFERYAQRDAGVCLAQRSQWSERSASRREALVRAEESLCKSLGCIRASMGCLGGRTTRLVGTAIQRHASKQLSQDKLQRCVLNDSAEAVGMILGGPTASPALVRDIFKTLVIHRAWRSSLEFASFHGPVLDHECLNLAIVVVGQSPAKGSNSGAKDGLEKPETQLDMPAGFVNSLLSKLGEEAGKALTTSDFMGRLPLHYAAGFGIDCHKMLRLIDEAQGQSGVLKALTLADHDGNTSVHYAVSGGHIPAVTRFMDILQTAVGESEANFVHQIVTDCLYIACQTGKDEIGDVLLQSKRFLQPGGLEELLHLVARTGNERRTKQLLEIMIRCGSNIDRADKYRGWTPLFEASARGHAEVAKLLLKAGADATIVDYRGWTAAEHAVYRGHLTAAQVLTGSFADYRQQRPEGVTIAERGEALHSHDGGHPGDLMIIVNLGSMQLGRETPTDDLGCCQLETYPGRHTYDSYRLEICVDEIPDQALHLNIPLLEDRSNLPLVFHQRDSAEPRLVFRIFKNGAGASSEAPSRLISGGTALLESNKRHCGARRQSLVREHTVSILDKNSMSYVGSILFTYVIVRPFRHLQLPRPGPRPTDGKQHRMELVGHRGNGSNVSSRSHIQLGENAIETFLAAGKLGASFIEFDAQVTKDLDVAIYHDFSLSETGTDIPIHDVTADQYRYAGTTQTPEACPVMESSSECITGPQRTKLRSWSLSHEPSAGTISIMDRLKHTVDFKKNGFKPNTRGHVVHSPLVTLNELFHKLPEELGFNIELKYPRIHEAVDAGVAPVAIELNLFVDTILEQIHQFGGNRPVVLSSFTPEVCILLALKQKAYPVMFIANAGKVPMNDMEKRVASTQIAVKFASRWGLAGICFASEPLLMCPRMIRLVKGAGLLCASYGTLNSEPKEAKEQRDAGLDLLVVDRVGLISKALENDVS